MTVPREEATQLLHDLDFDTLQLDEEYAINELNNLSITAKDGFSKEAIKYDFNIPEMSSVQMNSIINSLEKMRENLSKRVSQID